MPLDYALALCIILQPAETPVPDMPSLRHAARSIATSLEILDEREGRYVMERRDQWHADMTLLRSRWKKYHDAPHSHDANQFPDRLLINELLSFNRSYREHLEKQRQLYPESWELREAIIDTDWLYAIWDKARDTKTGYYYVTVRRQALKTLRDEIGEQAYRSGNLPPHVPVWRFGRMDK